MGFKKGNIPLYFQFYLQLKQEIISGDRVPGSPVPTIDELAKQTGISHGMIRKALGLLEMESLIVKRPRTGTFVREGRQKALWVPSSSLPEIRERLTLGKFIFLSDRFMEPPNRVMAHFKGRDHILKEGQIYQSHFIMISKDDDRRRDLAYMFVPLWRYEDLPLEALRESPLLTVSAQVKIVKIKQVTRPWICDHYTAGHLQIPDGTPILHRTVTAYLEDETPLAVLELLTNINALEREITID